MDARDGRDGWMPARTTTPGLDGNGPGAASGVPFEPPSGPELMALAASMFGSLPGGIPDAPGGGMPMGTSPSDLPTEPAVPAGLAATQGAGIARAADANTVNGPDAAQVVPAGGTPGAWPSQVATDARFGGAPDASARSAGLPGASTWPGPHASPSAEHAAPNAPWIAVPGAGATAAHAPVALGAPEAVDPPGTDPAIPSVPFVTADGPDPLIVNGLLDPPAMAAPAGPPSNAAASAPPAAGPAPSLDRPAGDLYFVREALSATNGHLPEASAASASEAPVHVRTADDIPAPATGAMAFGGRDPLVMTPGPSVPDAPTLSATPAPGVRASHAPTQGAPASAAPGSTIGAGGLQATPAPTAPTAQAATDGPPDVAASRAEFPALNQRVHGRPLVWLDNAATTQKPQAVIDAVKDYYEHDNSNIHRSAHALAARSSAAYEEARIRIARFLGAESDSEIIFTRGATEAINLLANTWGRANVGHGDEILISHLEHHSNIVPWQMLCRQTGAVLRVIPVDDRGDLDLAAYASLLGPRTKLVAITQVSNAIGTVVPVTPLVQLAHARGARVLIDGAQAVAHLPVCVGPAGIDFFAFSGHKIFAPTGIGVLYGRRELLEAMPPWQGGGSMITDVTFEQTVYAEPPAKFEAGTPHIAGAIGLGVALDWLETRGRAAVAAYEHQLMEYATSALTAVPGVRLIGAPTMRAGALPFVMEGYRPADVARHLDQQGIAVRAGHHCAQPILRRFGHETVVRPSFALYNTPADVDALSAALRMLPRR